MFSSSSPDATARPSLICSPFPGSTSSAPLSTRALLLSFTRSVSATLSLQAFIVALPVKVLFQIALIRSRRGAFKCKNYGLSTRGPKRANLRRDIFCPKGPTFALFCGVNAEGMS